MSAFTAGTPVVGDTAPFLNSATNKLFTFANGIGMADMLGSLTAASIAVTGAVTATISRMHLCTGTSADYTVTLPAASGNTGKFIGFRMGTTSTLTKLVTLDGNASETIDGALTRVMWAYETAILYCDGSNWFKVAGRTVPMRCEMRRTTSQTIADSSVDKILLATTTTDNTGMMANTGSNQVDIKRPSSFFISGTVAYAAMSAAGLVQGRVHVNGTLVRLTTISTAGTASQLYPSVPVSFPYDLAAGDNVTLHAYQNQSTSTTVGTSDVTGLSVYESQSW